MATTTFLLQDSPLSNKPLYVDGYVTDHEERPSVWIKFKTAYFVEHAAIQTYSPAFLEDTAHRLLALSEKLREAQLATARASVTAVNDEERAAW